MMKTTGHGKDHIPVVFACLADGIKLKAMVIFERKPLPKVNVPRWCCSTSKYVVMKETGWIQRACHSGYAK